MNLPRGLLERPIAHRGLWNDARPENSLPAFRAAREAGYGVELDVRLSADGEAMVFHDDTLDRMTNDAGIVEERTAAALQTLRLRRTGEHIPTLLEALDIVGDALVLIELKTPPGQEGPLEDRVAELAESHRGPVALIGFNAASHACLAIRHPDLPRGLNTADKDGQRIEDAERLAKAQPQFLLPSLDTIACDEARTRRKGGFPLVAWTVRSPGEWDKAHACADNYIFEGMRP